MLIDLNHSSEAEVSLAVLLLVETGLLTEATASFWTDANALEVDSFLAETFAKSSFLTEAAVEAKSFLVEATVSFFVETTAEVVSFLTDVIESLAILLFTEADAAWTASLRVLLFAEAFAALFLTDLTTDSLEILFLIEGAAEEVTFVALLFAELFADFTKLFFADATADSTELFLADVTTTIGVLGAGGRALRTGAATLPSLFATFREILG